MLRRRMRLIFCNCNHCQKCLDGELVNIVELRTIKPIALCDDCLEGLSKLTSLNDNKTHQYISDTKQIY